MTATTREHTIAVPPGWELLPVGPTRYLWQNPGWVHGEGTDARPWLVLDRDGHYSPDGWDDVRPLAAVRLETIDSTANRPTDNGRTIYLRKAVLATEGAVLVRRRKVPTSTPGNGKAGA